MKTALVILLLLVLGIWISSGATMPDGRSLADHVKRMAGTQ